MFPLITNLLIGGIVAFLVVYDILVAIFVDNDATLSRCMEKIGQNWNIVYVMWGGLTAHFFWNKSCGCQYQGFIAEGKPLLLLFCGFLVFRIAWPQLR